MSDVGTRSGSAGIQGVPGLPFAVLGAWCVVGLAATQRVMSRRG